MYTINTISKERKGTMKAILSFSLRKFTIFALVLCANYFIMPLSVVDSNSSLAIFIFLMPLLTLLTCFIYGCTSRSTPLFPFFSTCSFCSLCPLLFSKSADRNDPCICHSFLCRIRIRPPIESIYSKRTGMTKPVIRKKDMNSRVEIDKLCFYNKFTKAGEL